MNIELGPDGKAFVKGFSRLENLIINHRFQIGVHALAAKNLVENPIPGDWKHQEKLRGHANEMNRRFGILSGIVFTLGVKLTPKQFDALMAKLEIGPEEIEELAANAADQTPSYGETSLSE